ncbi:MAG: hypothetical protein IIW20_03015, partial [Clostridia bacterium]|nr:hypothetical protein [Clostridia bacterium]
EHYDFIYVDMRQHFEGREELLTENGYSNADGHRVYADEIYKELFSAVEEKRPATDLTDDGVFLSSEKIAEIKEKTN